MNKQLFQKVVGDLSPLKIHVPFKPMKTTMAMITEVVFCIKEEEGTINEEVIIKKMLVKKEIILDVFNSLFIIKLNQEDHKLLKSGNQYSMSLMYKLYGEKDFESIKMNPYQLSIL